MTVRIKGVTVELNGADYVIPPIALGALEQLQERIGSFDGNAADAGQISTVIDCAHAALKRNYPDLTREEVRFDRYRQHERSVCRRDGRFGLETQGAGSRTSGESRAAD